MNNFTRSGDKLVKVFCNTGGQIIREQVDIACKLLESGGVVALPTDTIYGIAARVGDSEALDRIYKIKGRDSSKPLAVCVSAIPELANIADTQKLDQRLLQSLLPGPVTLLLKRHASLNPNLNPGIETVGVRIPDQNFILAVANMVGPLALTSANRSGGENPGLPEDFVDLWPELDAVFDCGPLRCPIAAEMTSISSTSNQGSSVIDISQQGVYRIIRGGPGLNRVLNVLGRFGYRRVKRENLNRQTSKS